MSKDKVYKNIEDLLNHSQKLLGKTLFDLYGKKSKKVYKGKGGLGNKVEELHYGIKNNNNRRPDVSNLGVEIKTNPLNKLVKGGFTPKESVSLSMIDFTSLTQESFENSAFWKKNEKILYNMFLYDKNSFDFESPFLLIDLITPSKEDLKVIKNDWEYIKQKAEKLEADELSQSNTQYLVAMTKGGKNQIPQPYANGKAKAKRRAPNGEFYYKSKPRKDTIRILKPSDSGDIEKAVLSKFKSFFNKTDFQIAKEFGHSEMFILQDGKKNLDKSRWHNNTSLILTGKKKRFLSKYIEEFSKSGLTVKTIRVDKNYLPKEEVSFRTQDYSRILTNKWEESSLYSEMSCKFLWIIYMESENIPNSFILKHVLFWELPEEDLAMIGEKWGELKALILKGDYRHQYFQDDDSFYFLKIKDTLGGKNKEFNNESITNLSHWFRKAYVKDIILKSI